jgi:hypothetical protein
MSYQDAKVSIANYMAAQWGGSDKVVANGVTYVMRVENTPYNAPAGIPWLRWGIRPSDQVMADIGAGMKRDTGNIWFQIFLPPDKGSSAALLIGDELSAKFFEKDIDAVKTFSANLAHIGDDGTGWILWSVVVPYQMDTVG